MLGLHLWPSETSLNFLGAWLLTKRARRTKDRFLAFKYESGRITGMIRKDYPVHSVNASPKP